MPIDVMLVGITIDCKWEQSEKAELPIEVTLVGIVYLENRWFDGKQTSILRLFVKRIPSWDI